MPDIIQVISGLISSYFGMLRGQDTYFQLNIKDEYDKRLARASQCIDIMGFGLRNLREDYHDEFAAWALRAPVRILVLDPEFPSENAPLADLRDPEERNAAGAIRADVHRLIEVCQPMLQNDQGRFMIRLYRCLPSIRGCPGRC